MFSGLPIKCIFVHSNSDINRDCLCLFRSCSGSDKVIRPGCCVYLNAVYEINASN